MRILKYKTIENIRLISKDIPITKIDIKIVEKKEDSHTFDIFESKEYSYEEIKKDNIADLLKNDKKDLTSMKEEVDKNFFDTKLSVKNNIENTDDTDDTYKYTEAVNSSGFNYRTIDISKELDEDIYSDFKTNIEKSLDDTYFDDPYKTAIKLSQESNSRTKKMQKNSQRITSDKEAKSIEEMLEENEKEIEKKSNFGNNNTFNVSDDIKNLNEKKENTQKMLDDQTAILDKADLTKTEIMNTDETIEEFEDKYIKQDDIKKGTEKKHTLKRILTVLLVLLIGVTLYIVLKSLL